MQDKPKGTMLTKEFIEGLRWMGRKGYAFDLGIDQQGGGKWQLEEAVEMMEKAHEGVEESEKVAVVLSECFINFNRRKLTNNDRPSVQAEFSCLQPYRSFIHCLEDRNFHTKQVQ